jgi:hypothetical protein
LTVEGLGSESYDRDAECEIRSKPSPRLTC